MKRSTVLIVLSLLNALFFALHLTGDVVFGIEKGGREILVGVLILAVYLYGALGLPDRYAGYVILLLGGLASAALPVIHTMGKPLGERFAQLPGGFSFIWILLTVGATGFVAFILSAQEMWSLRQRRGGSPRGAGRVPSCATQASAAPESWPSSAPSQCAEGTMSLHRFLIRGDRRRVQPSRSSA